MHRAGDRVQLSRRRSIEIAAALVAFGLLLALAAGAQAAVGTEVSALTPSDQLNRTEGPLSYGGRWSPLAGTAGTGQDTGAGWGPVGESPAVSGAYWNTTLPSDAGTAAAIDLAALPGAAERYGSLWLDMPAPATAKTGYELRWTADPAGSTYTVSLLRWSAGVSTLLTAKAGLALPAGTTMAIADTGPTLSVWSGTGGSLNELLTVDDASFAGGYAGIAASGPSTRLANFRAGSVPLAPTVSGSTATVSEATAATLSAEVDPNGAATSYQFEYGPTTSYGTSVPVPAGEVGAGTTNVAVSQPIGGLEAATTYHYRLVATNSSGTVRDVDRTFATSAAPLAPFATPAETLVEGSGSDFAGMMWSGNASFPAPKETASAVKGTGSKWYRLLLYPEAKYESGAIDRTIEELAKKGITVLPYFGTGGDPDISVWRPFIKKEIKKYGYNGTFWQGKTYAKPMTWWEIGNEPNRGDTTPGGIPQAEKFGKFFAEAASAAREAASEANSGVKIIFASLYSTAETKVSNCGEPSTCKTRIGDYLRLAETSITSWEKAHTAVPRGSFDAVGVHPYVFKVGGHAIGQADIPAVMKQMNEYVEEAHTASLGKSVWVTEFGWPTEYAGSAANKAAVPPVSLQLQGELIANAFKEFKSHTGYILRAFYYNLADIPNGSWTGATGLREKRSGRAGAAARSRGRAGRPSPKRLTGIANGPNRSATG